jgi:enoyl-CoA hydratase
MGKIANYQKKENIAIITIDDGKANAVSPQFVAEVNAALDQAEVDKDVVILTGRPGKFSAGFDLSIVKLGGQAEANLFRSGAELALRLLGFPTPVIIASNGHCLAMGALLLLSTDLRIGVEGNFKIGLNEVAIGMSFMHWAVEIARARLTPTYLGRSVVNAEIYTPQGAIEAGFLDAIVPEEQLMKTAMQSAQLLAKLDMTAYYTTKLRVRENALNEINSAIKKDFGT